MTDLPCTVMNIFDILPKLGTPVLVSFVPLQNEQWYLSLNFRICDRFYKYSKF